MTLDQQARGQELLTKLALIQSELDEFKAEVKADENKFDDEFDAYLDSKEDWVRIIDGEGNIHWVDKAHIASQVCAPAWPGYPNTPCWECETFSPNEYDELFDNTNLQFGSLGKLVGYEITPVDMPDFFTTFEKETL